MAHALLLRLRLDTKQSPNTTVGLLITAGIAVVAAALERLRSDSWSNVLRAWWVDPAVATLSYAFAIDVFDRSERKLCGSPAREGSSGNAALLYWAGILVWVSIVPPPADAIPDGVPCSAAAAAYLALEVVSGILSYDFLFFFVHWAMHANSLQIHHTHHTYGGGGSRRMRARDALTHSPVDGVLQVLANICVQRSTLWGVPKSRVARALHNVLVTWMLTESHTCAPTPYVARRWCVGVQRHRDHHSGKAYYQQFFGYLDDLRGAVCTSDKAHSACRWDGLKAN